MLNTVLTVRAHQANSHKDIGWEEFTDASYHGIKQSGSSDRFHLMGSTGSEKGKDAYESQTPDPESPASESVIRISWIFRK